MLTMNDTLSLIRDSGSILDKHIDVLELSVRSYNALIKNNILTVRDLLTASEEDFLKIRNLGRKSISEINKVKKFLNEGKYSFLELQELDDVREKENHNYLLLHDLIHFFRVIEIEFKKENYVEIKQRFLKKIDQKYPFLRIEAISDDLFFALYEIYDKNTSEIQEVLDNDPSKLSHFMREHTFFLEWNHALNLVSSDNFGFYVRHLLDEELFKKMASKSISRVKDLKLLDAEDLNESNPTHQENLLKLLESLRYSVRDSISKGFSKADFTSRESMILEERIISKNMTLDELGGIIGVTRERVRQIEAKVISKLSSIDFSYLQYFSTLDLVQSMMIWPYALTVNDIKCHLGSETDVFIAYLSTNKELLFYPDYDFFVFKSYNWLEDYSQIIEEYNDIMDANEILEYFKMRLPHYFHNCPQKVDDLLLKMLESDLQFRSGKYSNSKISLGEMCVNIVDVFFPDGIRISSNEHYKEFCNLLEREYDYNPKSSSKRAMIARVTNVLVLADKNLYQVDHKLSQLSEELYFEILQYIFSISQSKFFYTNLFEVFKDRLGCEGIHNRYHFQSRFKAYSDSRFEYLKDYVIDKSGVNTDVIADNIDPTANMLSFKSLKSKLIGYTDVMISMWVNQSKDYINFYGQRIIKKSYIKTFVYEKDFVEIDLRNLFKDSETISTHYLFDKYKDKLKRMFGELRISGAYDVQQVLNVWFPEWLYFKRPLISLSPIEIESVFEFLHSYNKDKDVVYISELKSDINQTQFNVNNFLELLLDYEEYYYWMDANKIYRREYVNLNSDFLEHCNSILLRFFERTDVIDLNDTTIHNQLPSVGFEWNQYSIASIIRQHLSNIRVLYSTRMYHNVRFFAVLSDSEIRSYEDYLEIKPQKLNL